MEARFMENEFDYLWVLISAMLVFLMQAGFTGLESGMTRRKNSMNIAMKNIADFGISIACFWIIGVGLMFGPTQNGWFSYHIFFNASYVPHIFFIFQAMFCSTAASIVSGAVAERLKFVGYLIITAFISLFIYPLFGHWTWNGLSQGETQGWLAQMGFIDFAGSTVVHSTGGWVALAIVLILGARKGRFQVEQNQLRNFNTNNLPLSVLGTLLLWFGWFGFNGGSTLAFNNIVPIVIENTLLAGVFGMVTALFFGWFWKKRADLIFVINGTLGGLVSITANANAVSSYQAVLIGMIGGIIVVLLDDLLEKLKIDDVVGAIPVHLGGGIWGTLAVALFADLDKLNTHLTRYEQFMVQGLGILVCGILVFSTTYIIFWIINQFFYKLRVSEFAEEIGLDVAEHKVTTKLQELFEIMRYQAETQDFKIRVPQDPFTEVGQIGIMYNNVIFELEKTQKMLKLEKIALENVNEKAEALLLNILPKPIAQRLQQGEKVITDTFAEVTVLFADMTGFTKLSTSIPPEKLVNQLNLIFSEFDLRVEKYGIEKIKTIGDCYMAVAGIPIPHKNHAHLMAEFSLDIHEMIKCSCFYIDKKPLQFRIGINSGPVIAGVIGRRKFIYDLWGDTVNTASRMESYGIVGETQVTQETYELLKADYFFEKREPLMIKGKGKMQVYLLKGRKKEI
ncbi:MAG: ammonium transporter [Candidatus Parabeggiatoa sp.]|nr:ammonium transporter [Candidatus Parabeggiatoa sp.]